VNTTETYLLDMTPNRVVLGQICEHLDVAPSLIKGVLDLELVRVQVWNLHVMEIGE
jgi:hypothetical protein